MEKTMMKSVLLTAGMLLSAMLSAATLSEITIDLKLDELDYVAGERVRGVIDVKNLSPENVSVGYPSSEDRLFVEVYRSSDMHQLERLNNKPFVAPFRIDANEGIKLELMLAAHYALQTQSRYLARPVLVHRGMRFEGQYRAFDIVPGMKVASALQMFANRKNLTRVFELLRWSRQGREHLFLTAHDGVEENSAYRWRTFDVGVMMRITKPTISILPGGEVVVLHRSGPESFVRSEFWSLPDQLEFHSRQLVQDPETAAQSNVQEMYKKSGGVKPANRPWWKFW